MEFRRFLSVKNASIFIVTLTLVILTAGYFVFRKMPRIAMDKSAPATALAYIEINSVTDVLDGITDSRAWNEIAPVLGLSSQLKQLDSGISFMSSTGFGPDEVVIAGRAQYAVVVTGIEAGAETNEEGVYLSVKPRFALIVETHSSAEKAAKLASERASILAKRVFGDSTNEESSNYEGTRLITFRPQQPERQMVAAATGTKVLIANHESAMKACLDAIAGRTPTLAEDEMLRQKRGEVDNGSAIFAYVTASGVEKLSQFGPAIFARRFTNNPDALSMIANLFGHISKQTADGLFYSLQFENGGVTENYLTALRPTVAAGLADATKPATGASFTSLPLIPRDAQEGTVLTIEAVGALPENLLKQLSPTLDIVAGLALREFVINFRKQLALEPSDTFDQAIGNEIALVKMNQSDPVVMIFQVKARQQLMATMNRYLSKENASIASEMYKDIEIHVSTNEDGRAAAYVADFLVLGTRDQIKKIIDTKGGTDSAATDSQVAQAFTNRGQNASIISYQVDAKKTGEMMLAISKLMRVTDGSRELLDKSAMQTALSHLPYSTSFTSFRDSGVFTKTRSAVGVFKRFSDLLE